MAHLDSRHLQRHLWISQAPAEALWPQLSGIATLPCRALWLGEQGPPGMDCLPMQRVRHKLGQELDLIIFDGWSGLDPDALAAISGCLCAGGLLLLLLPEADPASGWIDPYLSRISARPEGFRRLFLQRLLTLFQAEDWVRWLVPEQPLPAWSPPPPPLNQPLQLTTDQELALTDLQRAALGRGRRPLVLISDRGRGKSTVLGIAAARLMRQGVQRILLTAERSEMLDSLFAQARAELGEPPGEGLQLHWGSSSLAFVPPDELLRRQLPADLLLVDEAAAIPGPLLEALLGRYNRIVFATTVQGYEGTGRGFILRFTARLDQLTPGWRRRLLQTPVRWSAKDRLEPLLYRALLLDAEPAPAELAASPEASLETLLIRHLSAAELVADEALLRQVQGLLLAAHYQTRPSDLRRLLDDPDLDCWLSLQQGQPLAALLSLREGGFSPELAEQIRLGRRRPQGHLLAQTLAAHCGFAAAAELRYRRVLRIAVHPQLQRRGLGLALLRHVLEQCRSEGLDGIGASFGATAQLLPFWYAAGLLPVRLGARRDAASGQHSLLMLRPLSPAAESLCQLMWARFAEQLPYLLADPLRDLEAEIACALLRHLASETRLSPQDCADLQAFAEGGRDYAGARLALWRLSLIAAASEGDAEALRVLILKVIQGRDWAEVAAQLQLAGQKPVLQALRAAVAAHKPLYRCG
ncbi:MAG: tRNA(Met) cytidine acetyltransferase [Gammaproteobacteria bacterium]|nr:tRNA(Met) cytidine acetyltransferase [Gammaproteobacteria bacterium]